MQPVLNAVAVAAISIFLGGGAEAQRLPPWYQRPSELIVYAPAGPLVGHYANNNNQSAVREFLGIPYAKPPTGPLRFAPPVRKEKFAQPFTADQFGASCYNVNFQLPGLGGDSSPILLPPPTREDEDCLSINIWAPSKRRQLRTPGGDAVMLWIYGGGFSLGTSETPTYNGKNIVRDQEGVIVVSFNYRLNIFGFPGAPWAQLPQKNPGLLDVRSAVEWVRDNIAAFGGNPKKIMLFGESAGGAATDAYLYYAKDDPIIRSAILQSGTIAISNDNLLGGGISPEARWTNLSKALNCRTDDAAANLDCIRNVPASVLRTTAGPLSFSPSSDNKTVFADTAARLARGDFARVPILIGSNDEEFPGDTAQAKLTTRIAFTCPAARSTIGRSARVPTWQYRFFGNFPAATGDLSPGAFHGSEISQIFGTFVERYATPEQRASSKYIQRLWADFAKDPQRSLLKHGWPKFKSNETTLGLLAYQNKASLTLANPAQFQAGC